MTLDGAVTYPAEDRKSKVLDDFRAFCKLRSRVQLRETTLEMYVADIDVLLRHHGLPLCGLTVDVLREVVVSRGRDNISPTTHNKSMVVLRRWAEFQGLDPESREVRRTLQFKRAIPKRQLSDSDILTPEDVERVIRHVRTPAWKCLVALMWDTGARIGEITKLESQDIVRDRHGFVLHIRHSKTMERKLRVLTRLGLVHLTNYYNSRSGNGYFFVTTTGTRISEDNVRAVLSNIEHHVGKRLYPNLFRKSASTWWKKRGINGVRMTDPAIRKRLGHKKDSRTFEQWYLQFGDSAYAEEELSILGFIKRPDEEPMPKKCWRCGFPVDSGSGSCPNCHALESGKVDDVAYETEIRQLKETIEWLQKSVQEQMRDVVEYVKREIRSEDESRRKS